MVQAWTYIDGRWVEGNPPMIGPMTHAAWLSTLVFDGARAFEGVAPDLNLHCARAVRSATFVGLKAPVTPGEIHELCWEGINRFPKTTALYVRPMFFAEDGMIQPDPASTRFVLSVYEAPLPPAAGFTACLSPFRRPSPEGALTEAKAACLYPNVGRAMKDAADRGFDNCVVLDPIGNVAEFATANLFFAKDGAVHTPAPNGTFLAGITRARVIGLLRNTGLTVHERAVRFAEVMDADEVFSTGNYSKVVPATRVEKRNLQPGPVFKKARELYWEFAHKS
ncbi:MAG: branched-chain amino acid aminotransferase [Alphaproteobacteria bacterium]|nr:branched-chain amino acid aminotransferase [Alphaproteobacteria bacterium]